LALAHQLLLEIRRLHEHHRLTWTALRLHRSLPRSTLMPLVELSTLVEEHLRDAAGVRRRNRIHPSGRRRGVRFRFGRPWRCRGSACLRWVGRAPLRRRLRCRREIERRRFVEGRGGGRRNREVRLADPRGGGSRRRGYFWPGGPLTGRDRGGRRYRRVGRGPLGRRRARRSRLSRCPPGCLRSRGIGREHHDRLRRAARGRLRKRGKDVATLGALHRDARRRDELVLHQVGRLALVTGDLHGASLRRSLGNGGDHDGLQLGPAFLADAGDALQILGSDEGPGSKYALSELGADARQRLQVFHGAMVHVHR
jgi:hypothetical protein